MRNLREKARKSNLGGFSLVELAIVVSILAIFSALSVPSILTWLKTAKIDEAKSLVSAAASDCLSQLRQGNEMVNSSPNSSVISDERLESSGYKIDKQKRKCSLFMITPIAEDNFLYTLGFNIVGDGRIIKVAIPAKDLRSLSSCKSWAGENCGITPEMQAELDRLAAIEKAKKECNDKFFEWINQKKSGSNNRWDDESNSCTKQTWSFEGTIQSSEEAFKAAREAKLGKICSQRLVDKASEKFDGLFQDEDCGIGTYFFLGEDLNTDDSTIYDAKRREYEEAQCSAAEQAWLSSAKDGAFPTPPGLSCTAKWKCNSQIFLDQASYESSACFNPPPPPCTEPPKPAICRLRPGLPVCSKKC